jgi:acetyl-CoA acetyltransferase
MRTHAQLNPKALMYGKPLTAEAYHSAEWIAEPFQKFDCCLESDGAVAVVVTTPERARAGSRDFAHLRGIATHHPITPDDLVNRPNWFASGVAPSAAAAYESAGFGPEEMDFACLYDCFTFEVIHQLEEAGICPHGTGSEFVLSGATRLGGRLPVNPHGGLLSEAHVLGMNHVAEAVRQLRGECGSRQVAGAQRAMVTGWGGMGDGGVAVFERAAN